MRNRLKFKSVVSQRLLAKPFRSSSYSSNPLGQITHTCDSAPDRIEADSLKLVSLNVAHGRRRAFSQALLSKQQIERNLNQVCQTLTGKLADVVAFQEVDAASLWSGRFDHVDYLRNGMGLKASILGCHMETGTLNYGTALVSRSSLHSSQSIKFEPTPPTTTKGFVVSTLTWRPDNNDLDVSLVSLHLDFARSRARDQQIDALVAQLKKRQGPFIIMGDMNCDWHSAKSQVRRLCDDLNLIAYRPTEKGLSTFGGRLDARVGVNTARRLDWILISEELAFKHYSVLPEGLSDHQAVFAEVVLA